MTRFLTVEEMIERVGIQEMTDIAGIGRERHEDGRRVDEAKVEAQILFAEELVISKTSARYSAIADLTPENAPRLVKGFVEDIARYRLRGRSANQNQVTDVVYDRYKDACKTLDDIKMNRASLDLPANVAGGASTGFSVKSDFPENRADELLAGY